MVVALTAGDAVSSTGLSFRVLVRSCIQVAMDLEVEDINAHLTRLDGVAMLEKLRRQGRVADVLQPALPLPPPPEPAGAAGGGDA